MTRRLLRFSILILLAPVFCCLSFGQNESKEDPVLLQRAEADFKAAEGALNDGLFQKSSELWAAFLVKYTEDIKDAKNIRLLEFYQRATINSGKARESLGDFDKAIEFYLAAYDMNVGAGLHAAARLYLQMALEESNQKKKEKVERLGKARDLFNGYVLKYTKDEAASFSARMGAARAAYELSHLENNSRPLLDKALSEYQNELKVGYKRAPDDDEIWYYIGICLFEQGDLKGAMQSFGKLEENEYVRSAYLRRALLMKGEAYYYQKDWGEAEKYYTRALNGNDGVDTDTALEAHYALAWAQYKLGESRRDSKIVLAKFEECERNLEQYILLAEKAGKLPLDRQMRSSLLRARCLLRISKVSREELQAAARYPDVLKEFERKKQNLLKALGVLAVLDVSAEYRPRMCYLTAETYLQLSVFGPIQKGRNCYDEAQRNLDDAEKLEKNLSPGKKRSPFLDRIELARGKTLFLRVCEAFADPAPLTVKDRQKYNDDLRKAQNIFKQLEKESIEREQQSLAAYYVAEVLFLTAEIGRETQFYRDAANAYKKLLARHEYSDIVINESSRLVFQQILCSMKEDLTRSGTRKTPIPPSWEVAFRNLFDNELLKTRLRKQEFATSDGHFRLPSNYAYAAFLLAGKAWINRYPEDYENIKSFYRRLIGKDRLEAELDVPVETSAQAELDYADFCFSSGLYDEAARHFNEIAANPLALEKSPELVAIAYRRFAQTLLKQGKKVLALEALQKAQTVLKDSKFHQAFIVDMAEMHSQDEKYANILKLANDYLVVADGQNISPDFWYWRGQAAANLVYKPVQDVKLSSNELAQMAIESYKKALALSDQGTPMREIYTRQQLAHLWLSLVGDAKDPEKRKMRDDAFEEYESALKKCERLPDLDTALSLKKDVLLDWAQMIEKNDESNAVKKLEEAVVDGGMGENGGKALLLLGAIQQRRAKMEKALDCFLKFIYGHKGEANYAAAVESAARCLEKLGRTGDAKKIRDTHAPK